MISRDLQIVYSKRVEKRFFQSWDAPNVLYAIMSHASIERVKKITYQFSLCAEILLRAPTSM